MRENSWIAEQLLFSVKRFLLYGFGQLVNNYELFPLKTDRREYNLDYTKKYAGWREDLQLLNRL